MLPAYADTLHRGCDRRGTARRRDIRQRDVRGNYVVVEHVPGEYSVLAHLREGSIAVSDGDRVEPGQRIERCGHSGNSTEPHLHCHVQDSPSFYREMGLPVAFESVGVADGPDGESVRAEHAALRAGQRVVQRKPERTTETEAETEPR